jgi:hypothetical protein
MRARTLVLPGEDAEAYQGRLEDWTETFRPRDPVESYLVGRVVHVSWQLDRADRAEAARLTEAIDREEKKAADRRAAEVRVAGRWLLRRESAPPGPMLERLEASATGCRWMLDRWAGLRRRLERGRTWRPRDQYRAIRLLGKMPLDGDQDDEVALIYRACAAMDPQGPDAFNERWCELSVEEEPEFRDRLRARAAAAPGPDTAEEGKAALLGLVAGAVERLEAVLAACAEAEADAAADRAARLGFDTGCGGEQVRRHQATCSRTLLRMLEALRRHRRHVAGEGLLPEGEGEASVRAAASPREGEPPCEPVGEMARTEPRPPQDTPRGTDSDPAGPGADAIADAFVDVDESPASQASAPECPAGSDGPPPPVPEPPGIAPTDDPGIPAATNEANSPGVATNEANRPGTPRPSDAEPGEDGARGATNEANRPAEAAARPAATVAILALLVCLLSVVRSPLSAAGLPTRPGPSPSARADHGTRTTAPSGPRYGAGLRHPRERTTDNGQRTMDKMEEPWIIVKHPG